MFSYRIFNYEDQTMRLQNEEQIQAKRKISIKVSANILPRYEKPRNFFWKHNKCFLVFFSTKMSLSLFEHSFMFIFFDECKRVV